MLLPYKIKIWGEMQHLKSDCSISPSCHIRVQLTSPPIATSVCKVLRSFDVFPASHRCPEEDKDSHTGVTVVASRPLRLKLFSTSWFHPILGLPPGRGWSPASLAHPLIGSWIRLSTRFKSYPPVLRPIFPQPCPTRPCYIFPFVPSIKICPQKIVPNYPRF